MKLCSLILLAFALGLFPAPAQDLAITGARVLSMTGTEATEATIVIRGGRIADIGPGVKVPEDLTAIDATGLTVTPGLVLAHSSDGLDRANEMTPVVPYVSVLDSLDPSSRFFEDAARDGHLVIGVMPGNGTIIGGMGRVVQPRGLTVEDMTVIPDLGLKFSLIPAQNTSRAAQLSKLRAALDDALQHLEKKKRDADSKTVSSTGNVPLDLQALQVERRKEALVRALLGDVPVVIACATAADVEKAHKILDDYKLRGTLWVAPTAWRAAPLLAKRGAPVILSSDFEVDEVDPDTGKEVHRVMPKILHEAKVKFAVTSASSSLGRRYLWYQAACLVRYGLSREEAWAAVTTIPAGILGLGERKGSLAKGKDADLVFWTDDPLSGMAWVDRTVIGGRVSYERSKDPRLAEVFGVEAR